MNEVYVIAGGEWLRNNLNAIAAFMNTRTWDSIEKIALTLSVVAVAFMWVQRHNVMDLLGWVAVFVLISLLVNVRTSVQIIDNSDLVKVHRVDNVPVGLAMPLSLTTRIGHAMVVSYEMIFTQPDTSYGIAGLLMLAVSHRLYRAEDRAERLALVACLLAVIPALNLASSDAAAVAGLVMTMLTVGLVSCAGKSLPRFWPGDFFPVFYACHLAVLGVLAL